VPVVRRDRRAPLRSLALNPRYPRWFGSPRGCAASSTYRRELLRAVVNGDPNPMGAAAATIRGLLDPEHAAAVQRELAAVRPAIVDDLGSDLHPS